jgi:LmbE family N-acetylglucosaminyl deacetylase
MYRLNTDIIRKITEKKYTLIAVSPHLDDGILSAGGLLLTLKGTNKVVNITIFTSASAAPSSFSVKAFLSQCKYPTAEALYEDRKKEDIKVFSELQADSYHLGQVDALWRQLEKPEAYRKLLAKMLPEFSYTYPIYRFDVISGKVSGKDKGLILRTAKQISEIVKKYQNPLILCPIGIGKNVDHVLTRDLCTSEFKNIIYWSDMPYGLHSQVDEQFTKMNNLTQINSDYGITENNKLVEGYKTQFDALFPNKVFPNHNETFYLSSNLASEILDK